MQFRYCDLPQKSIPTPFIRLKSLGGGQTFCLWIKKTVVTEPSGSTFSSYGLSAVSTVPEF
jgi:CRISPR-associated endonuclease Csy4